MEDQPTPSFDRATYTDGATGGARCSQCHGLIHARYWSLGNAIFCESCQAQLSVAVADARAKASFGKAALLGGGVALACGIAYAIFVQVSGIQLALITIGIAWAVAKVVRRASAGLSGRRFQILAVVLTYVASAMGYAGPVLSAMRDGAHAQDAVGEKKATSDHLSDDKSAPGDKEGTGSRPGAGQVLAALAIVFGIILAAPVLAATQAPIGLLIVAIGLFQAWKLSRPIAIALDGPHDLSSAPAPSV